MNKQTVWVVERVEHGEWKTAAVLSSADSVETWMRADGVVAFGHDGDDCIMGENSKGFVHHLAQRFDVLP